MRRTCAPLLACALLLALAGPAPGFAAQRRSAGSVPIRRAAWNAIAAQYPAVAWLLEKIGILIDPSGRDTDGKIGIGIDPSGREAGGDIGILIDPDGRESGGKIGIGIDPDGRESGGNIGIRIDPDGLEGLGEGGGR